MYLTQRDCTGMCGMELRSEAHSMPTGKVAKQRNPARHVAGRGFALIRSPRKLALPGFTGGSYVCCQNRITSLPQGILIAPEASLSNFRRSVNYRRNVQREGQKANRKVPGQKVYLEHTFDKRGQNARIVLLPWPARRDEPDRPKDSRFRSCRVGGMHLLHRTSGHIGLIVYRQYPC